MSAGSFVNVIQTAIFLAVFLDKTACYEVLKFLVGAETKHFFATADGITSFQIFINNLKEVIESKGLLIGQYCYQFVGNMIWHPA